MVEYDKKISICKGGNNVTGNEIDLYHINAFEEVGINNGFYGGNLWPQSIWPNPVPQDNTSIDVSREVFRQCISR